MELESNSSESIIGREGAHTVLDNQSKKFDDLFLEVNTAYVRNKTTTMRIS
jgi:hypothetical protein